jgi:general secretion pathway protein A
VIMYKNFFGLHEHPFNINPDPRFLHRTPLIQEALDQLTYGVQNRKGLLLLTGEVGTGKTTLINHLLDWLRQQNTPTAFIFNSQLKVNHLFDFILNDFGISTDARLVNNMLLELNQWLIQRFRAGCTPVLIVDEAQGLSFELLEEIRLLLNLETASEKLLQIVLVGQPELEEKLKQPELRQLRQRIALRCTTAPLSLEDARGYIVDRLRIAGATREPVFESDAVEALHYYSRGIPRVMNLLCEHALINAYVEELNPVPLQMVEEAARDFLMEEFRPFGAYAGVTMSLNCKLNVVDSEITSESGRCLREEAGISLVPIVTERPSHAMGLVEEERELRPGMCMVMTTSEEGDAVSAEDLNTSLSVPVLVSPSPEFVTRPEEILTSNPSAAQSVCAAELMATLGRLFAADGSVRMPQQKSSRVELESVQALTCRPPGKRLGPAISTARRPGVSVRIPWTVRKTRAAAGVVLQQWRFGFIRDWKLMVSALKFPRMNKSIGHWLTSRCRPTMRSSKNQTL